VRLPGCACPGRLNPARLFWALLINVS